jgi:hypothetical protein
MAVSGTSWTYALVTPDGLVTQALPRLLDTFRSAGLDPVAAELIRQDAETMPSSCGTTSARPVLRSCGTTEPMRVRRWVG